MAVREVKPRMQLSTHNAPPKLLLPVPVLPVLLCVCVCQVTVTSLDPTSLILHHSSRQVGIAGLECVRHRQWTGLTLSSGQCTCHVKYIGCK